MIRMIILLIVLIIINLFCFACIAIGKNYDEQTKKIFGGKQNLRK
jgi:hypothetical protein